VFEDPRRNLASVKICFCPPNPLENIEGVEEKMSTPASGVDNAKLRGMVERRCILVVLVGDEIGTELWNARCVLGGDEALLTLLDGEFPETADSCPIASR
jgi:hypothetical protein